MFLNTAGDYANNAPSPDGPRSAQHPSVLSRLNALFPTPTTNLRRSNTFESMTPPPSKPPSPAPKALKIRIVTWNMHDSVPKGDLEDLLGAVPAYYPLDSDSGIPDLPADGDHPYHLVIVAGQECPSLSGMPMGIGAGFKLKDKEKAKEKDKDKDKDDLLKLRKSFEDAAPDHSTTNFGPSGWTSIVENWLCYGGGKLTSAHSLAVHPDSPRGSTPPEPPPRIPKDLRKGPYQMLLKERMMGIYLAVYIHRDLRHFVKGTSKSVVTAGLIGGRVGNKGAVGISLKIEKTTFLFMNAHLAAHGDKVGHRLANLTKIKNELSVDAFLDAGDPREMSEDLTNKFDYTFLFGDLNFRLNITRLHADWLIARQDYTQALGFDQLLDLMHKNEGDLVGFQEAPIDFPPTFKYDVQRGIKVSKSQRSIKRWRSIAASATKKKELSEIQERDNWQTVQEDLTTEEHEDLDPHQDDGEEGEEEGNDVTSLVSSLWTSKHSKANTDVDPDDSEDYFQRPSSSRVNPNQDTLAHKLHIITAAHKAKTKWKSLLTPLNTPVTPKRWSRSRSEQVFPSDDALLAPLNSAPMMTSKSKSTPIPISSVGNASSIAESPMPSLLQAAPSMARHSSTRSPSSLHSEDSNDEDEPGSKGVYDSSHKQRVPSWCDRILWKTTVEPEPDEEESATPDNASGHRVMTRVSQFLTNALRSSRPTRGRKESVGSSLSLPTSEGETPAVEHNIVDSLSVAGLPLHDAETVPSLEPMPVLKNSQSIDALPKTDTNPEIEDPSSTYSRRLSLPPTAAKAPPRLTLAPIPPLSITIPSTEDDSPPPVPPKDQPQTHRWRFLSFLREPSTAPATRPPSIIEKERTPMPRHKRGEVECVRYETLDDRAMRRLEGRSDHRPVIGVYNVYI